MKKIVCILFVVCLISVIPSVPADSILNNEYSNIENKALFEEHLIEGVPYSYQEKFGCLFASLDMIFKYHGKNSSLAKNVFYNGVPYSFIYQRNIKSFTTLPFPNPPYFSSFWWSTALGQGADDYSFLGSVYGLNLSVSYPESVVFNHYKAWNEWWPKVKNYITDDIPVCTGIDPCSWPIYLEFKNLTKPISGRGGHAIVIVGFNEKNRTICVQDPMAGSEDYYNPGRIGYQWISFFDFKRSMRRSYWEFSENSYWIIAVDNVSNTPDYDYSFRVAHNRNIQRLKGNKSAYDKIYLDNFKFFGIDALTALRDQYKSLKLCFLLPFFRVSAKITANSRNPLPFGWTAGGFKIQALEDLYVSEFLNETKTELTDEDLSIICDYESVLFKNASENFFQLGNLTFNLNIAFSQRSLIKSIIDAKAIIADCVLILDDLISIHEKIIAGPFEEV